MNSEYEEKRMQNFFWPVYLNLEAELNKLMLDIHIDDNQLKVYSSKISSLILTAAAEVESISKELYFNETNEDREAKSNIPFDHVAIKKLNDRWKLDRKVVLVSSLNCFFKKPMVIKPFEKNEENKFSWNASYQNLKHDRLNALKDGNIECLLNIMATLFVLNIYYKDSEIPLGEANARRSFPFNLDSDIFSVKLHERKGVNSKDGTYIKAGDFNKCVYFSDLNKKSRKEVQDLLKKIWSAAVSKMGKNINENPKLAEKISSNPEVEIRALRSHYLDGMYIENAETLGTLLSSEHIAVVNKNQV